MNVTRYILLAVVLCLGVAAPIVAAPSVVTFNVQQVAPSPVVPVAPAAPVAPAYTPKPSPGLVGIQAGFISGIFFAAKSPTTDMLLAVVGSNDNNFALQIQLNKVYTVQSLSCYYGVSGMIINAPNPQLGLGVPLGLVYKVVDGPTLSLELAPTLLTGVDFKLRVYANGRVGIPF